MKLAAYQKTLPTLPPILQSNDYLVPDLVLEWGKLVGAQSSAVASEWTEDEYTATVVDRYRALCTTTALLLHAHHVHSISAEAVASATHRWALKIDPWVALGARVDSVHQAYRHREDDGVAAGAEKLWAALENRCQSVTGKSFSEVLG